MTLDQKKTLWLIKCVDKCIWRHINQSENKIGTSKLVQKPHSRTNYIESIIEEDIDMNAFGIKNLPDTISSIEAATKYYIDNKFNDPGIKNWHMLTSLIKFLITFVS